MKPTPDHRLALGSHAWIVALIIVVTASVFSRGLSNGFVGLDDAAYLGNHWVASPVSWDSIRHLWFSESLELWHPLTPLWFHLIRQLFGLHAWAFHGASLLFHIGNAVWVYVLFIQLTGCRFRSALVSILFAVHPLRVESVAWAAEFKDVGSAFFALACMVAYVRYARRPTRTGMAISVLSLSISLLFKPMFVTMPAILLLLDFWPLGRFDSSIQPVLPEPVGLQRSSRVGLILEKIPWAVPVMADSFVVFWLKWIRELKPSSNMGVHGYPFPLWLRLENLPISYVRYLIKGVWFPDLLFFYPMPASWPAWQVGGSTALLAGVTFAAWRGRRAIPIVWTGWLWFLIALLPVSGIQIVSNYSLADRYTYFAHIGLIAALVFAWPSGRPASAWPRRLGLASLGGVVVFLSFATWSHIGDWDDSAKLIQREIDAYPDDPVGRLDLGIYYSSFPERREQARQCFLKSIALDPDFGLAHYQHSLVLESMGHLDVSIAEAEWVTRNAPLFDGGWGQLGRLYFKQGRIDLAILNTRRAIELDPTNADWRDNLGRAYLAQGRDDLAQQAFADAIASCEWDPAEPHRYLGLLESKYGRGDLAIKQFQRAFDLEPSRIQLRIDLGIALVEAGRLSEGLSHLESVNRAAPGQYAVLIHMGLAHQNLNRPDLAISDFQNAIAAAPTATEARLELARALLAGGRAREALGQVDQVLRIDPHNPAAPQLKKSIEQLIH